MVAVLVAVASDVGATVTLTVTISVPPGGTDWPYVHLIGLVVHVSASVAGPGCSSSPSTKTAVTFDESVSAIVIVPLVGLLPAFVTTNL
jgi:hypothetical protein